MKSVGRVIVGVIFGIVLLLTSGLGVIFLHSVPYLFAIFFLSAYWYRFLADRMVGSWIIFCCALLEKFMGMKVVITGEKIARNERVLIVMNHRTRLDWMYFWSVLVRQSGVSGEKIILKAPLKKLPGAGWAMQIGAFIFVHRKWEDDKKVLTKMLNYFSDLGHKTQVLLFPEGTDLTPRTKARSDEFAKKNNCQPYDYVLHPRTTGFTHVAHTMMQNSHLDAIYDVSIAYPYNFPQTEPELILGNVPKEVHFHIKRHSVQSLPINEEGLQDWCRRLWDSKEERLRNFYEKNAFVEEACGDPGEITAASSSQESMDWILRLAIVYWTVFVTGIIILLWLSSLARWCALIQICFLLYMGHMYGGFEIFQVDYFNKFFNKVKRE